LACAMNHRVVTNVEMNSYNSGLSLGEVYPNSRLSLRGRFAVYFAYMAAAAIPVVLGVG
jgi:hypothetical protein